MRKGLLILALLLVVMFGAFYISTSLSFSDGFRSGSVVKLSKKGILFKTHEGQLNTGGMAGSQGDDINAGVWNFSVSGSEDQVLKDLEAAIDHGYRVKLYYKERFFHYSFLGDTKYFVYQVERVGDDKTLPPPSPQ